MSNDPDSGQDSRVATIVLGDYHHTASLKKQPTLAGHRVDYPSIVPVWDAFDAMVRTQDFSICEMAIVAFLQAYDAGKPLLLLPMTIVGGFHHRSIVAAPVNAPAGPADLVGKRVGVRSYSQTTCMWVRAILEDHGVRAADIAWVANEASHSEAYADPPNVEQTDAPLEDLLRSGALAAAILGRQADKRLLPLIPSPGERDREWFEEHGVVPINHMVVTTAEMVDSRPELVRAFYQALAAEIDATRELRSGGKLPSATDHGFDKVRPGVRLAAEYAASQGLISRVPDIDSLFIPPACLGLA